MRKLFVLLTMSVICVVSAWALEAQVNDSIYSFTTEPASYPGGDAAMLKQLAEHIELPNGLAKNFSGSTAIRGIVEKNGALSNLQIVKSCGRADVDSAVLKAAAHLLDYTPAKNDGQVVRSYTFVPASFPMMFKIIPPKEVASAPKINAPTAKTLVSVLTEVPTLTNDTLKLPHIPETGEVLYAGAIQTSYLTCANPFLPTNKDSIHSWVESVHFEKIGVNNQWAVVERQGDLVQLVWSRGDTITKDEYFRVLDQQTMQKEKDVLYTRDGNLRHNYFVGGRLKKSFLLNTHGDTISMWRQIGSKNLFEYIYNVDDYTQLINTPYINGKQEIRCRYRTCLGKEIVEPSVKKIEIKLANYLQEFTEEISKNGGYSTSVSFKYENIAVEVYALVSEEGHVIGDYNVVVKDAKISIRDPFDYARYVYGKEIAEATDRHKAKIAQYVLSKLSKNEIKFVPGMVDGKAATMPCLMTFKLDSHANVSCEKLWPYAFSFAPQTDEEWIERLGLKFEAVEEMPEFPGGYEELYWYVDGKVKYPVIAQENGIQGKAIVSFVIDTDGSVVDVKVEKSTRDASLDKEAMRVIKSMPKWIPGKNHGEVVRVKYTVPINFRLQ